jgi:hypothetical protein
MTRISIKYTSTCPTDEPREQSVFEFQSYRRRKERERQREKKERNKRRRNFST